MSAQELGKTAFKSCISTTGLPWLCEVIAAAANLSTVLQDPNKRSFHFCIVNLVIGTLYCVKGNFEFGIARIIKSMEPESQKLETDTWFYAKRCFLALLEGVAKHMINLKVGLLASSCAVMHLPRLGKSASYKVSACSIFAEGRHGRKRLASAAATILCQRL